MFRFIDNYTKNIPQILTHKIVADTETPVSTLLKISKNEKYSFLLESVEGGKQRGRYSLLGIKPDIIWECKKNKINLINLKNGKKKVKILNTSPFASLRNLLNDSLIEV